jgi:ubiquinone/menaquinone biosynthesis C-methylase UbiE
MDEPLEKYWRRKFQRYAQKYEKESEISGWSDHGLSRRMTTFGRVLDSARLPSDALIVDLGCGAGTYCRFLRKRGFRIIGLDYSLPILKRAQELQGDEEIQLLNGEVYNLPLSDQCVDVVVCIGVLQTLSDEKRALKEIRRVLKPGGVLFLDGINALGINELMKWKPGNQLRTYNPFILRKYLERKGFQCLKITGTYILPSFLLSLENHLESKRIFEKMDVLLFLFIFLARAFILVGTKNK